LQPSKTLPAPVTVRHVVSEAPPVEEELPVDDVSPEERNILTIRYNMNGGPWLVLGAVGESSWQRNAHFDIPFTSWEDLNSLQVSFTSVSVSDIAPVVYLDGMSLAVDYESADGLILKTRLCPKRE